MCRREKRYAPSSCVLLGFMSHPSRASRYRYRFYVLRVGEKKTRTILREFTPNRTESDRSHVIVERRRRRSASFSLSLSLSVSLSLDINDHRRQGGGGGSLAARILLVGVIDSEHVAERTAALDQVDLRWPTDRPKGEMRRRTRRIQGGEGTRCSGTGCSAGGRGREARDERTSGTRTKTAVRMADEGGSVDHLCPWWGDTVGSSSFLFFRTLRDRPGPFLRIRSLPCASIPPASCARDAVSSLSLP